MPKFQPGKPVITEEPKVTVDPGLQPGKYRFQLAVEDEDGNQSQPNEVIVTIIPRRIPTGDRTHWAKGWATTRLLMSALEKFLHRLHHS